MEPVVSETQLRSFSGPNVIKLAPPESIKPPRTSPLVTTATDNSSTTARSPQTHGVTSSGKQQLSTSATSSPQTRRLAAPESLRRPHTPPNLSAHGHRTSSPQTRHLMAPDSLKPTHSTATGSAHNQPASSSLISKPEAHESTKAPHKVPSDNHDSSPTMTFRHEQKEYDSEDANDLVMNSPLNALPRYSALAAAGDAWLEANSGGSQVSIGSHSPKPQSVSHFAIDVEDGAGTSQSQSQTSEVDCTYIGPSNVESIFVTSGYMYIAPPPSDFSLDKNSVRNDRKHSSPPSNNTRRGQKTSKGETHFGSSAAPSTTVLDEPSSTVSTAAGHDNLPPAAPTKHSTTDENGDKNALVKSDQMSSQEKVGKDSKVNKNKGSVSGSSPGVTPDTTDSETSEEMPSVADRRLAFEQQARFKEGEKKLASKPATKPPAVPKRVSSITTLEKSSPGNDTTEKNITNSTSESSSSLVTENKATVDEEKPPPPPMSTHPGLAKKSESDEQLEIREDNTTIKSVANSPEATGEFRPKPKERRVSVPAVPPANPKPEIQEDSTPASGLNAPIGETEGAGTVSGANEGLDGLPAPLQKDKGMNDSESNARVNTEVSNGQQGVNSKEASDYNEPPLRSTFGHISPSTSTSLGMNVISEEPSHEEKGELDEIDPSKYMGAEVSSFRPVPKPRSLQRHSMYAGNLSPPATESASNPVTPVHQAANNINAPAARMSLLAPPTHPNTYTPEMKRNSMHFPTPENKRDMILRAQSMTMLPTTGSASPRMRMRGEQRSQMPPGFVVFSRSQEAVVGRHPSMSSNMMVRSIQASQGDGDKKAEAITAPMNTKRAPKRRRSFFKRK